MICITSFINDTNCEILVDKNSGLTISDWIAILALIISILSVIVSVILTLYLNEKERRNHLIEKSFENIFFEELPKELNYFYEKRNEKSYNKLTRVIEKLLDKLLFYKYYKKDMYDKTKNLIVELEEICTKYMNIVDPQIWIEVEKILKRIVKEIYK